MKKLLVACCLAGMIAGANAHPAMSESGKAPGPHMMMQKHKLDPAEQAAHLQKTLQLSDEQTAKAKKVFENSEQQQKALADKYKPQLDAFHEDMKNLHEKTQTELSGILTAKQKEAFKAQHKMRGGMCPRDEDDKEGMPGDGAKVPAK